MEGNECIWAADGTKYFIYSRTYTPNGVLWEICKRERGGEWEIIAEDLTETQADGMRKLLLEA